MATVHLLYLTEVWQRIKPPQLRALGAPRLRAYRTDVGKRSNFDTTTFATDSEVLWLAKRATIEHVTRRR
eukprot:2086235-Pyramimonas_sp.AAC.1